MDKGMKKFLHDLDSIMGSEKINETSMQAFYQNLKQMEGGEIVLQAIDDVASIHNLRQVLKNYRPSDPVQQEYLTIDLNEIVHIKGESLKSCETEHSNYVQKHFKEVIKILDSEEVQKVFTCEEYYTRVRDIRYKVGIIEESDEKTIECLKTCIELVKNTEKVTFNECVKCCGYMIQMIPIGKLDKGWKECRRVICKGFKKIYDARWRYNGQGSTYELLGKCGSEICDIEYWGFLAELYNTGGEQAINIFWKKLERRMKAMFEKQCGISYNPKRGKSTGKAIDLRPIMNDMKNM